MIKTASHTRPALYDSSREDKTVSVSVMMFHEIYRVCPACVLQHVLTGRFIPRFKPLTKFHPDSLNVFNTIVLFLFQVSFWNYATKIILSIVGYTFDIDFILFVLLKCICNDNSSKKFDLSESGLKNSNHFYVSQVYISYSKTSIISRLIIRLK